MFPALCSLCSSWWGEAAHLGRDMLHLPLLEVVWVFGLRLLSLK